MGYDEHLEPIAPWKVKASADLCHHLLELHKKRAEIASCTPVVCFNLQHLGVQCIVILTEDLPLPYFQAIPFSTGRRYCTGRAQQE